MKITHFGEYNSISEQTREEFLKELAEEGRDYSTFETKQLPKGTKILVLDAMCTENDEINEPESLVELTEETLAKCMGFGVGLTSDHYIVLDDSSDKLVLICNEPIEVRAGDSYPKYTGPKHDADYILVHM
jgi:hypothetical protein